MKIGMISLFLLSSQIPSKASDEYMLVAGIEEDEDYYIIEPTIKPPAPSEKEEPKTPEQCWDLVRYSPPLFPKIDTFPLWWPLTRKIHKMTRIGK